MQTVEEFADAARVWLEANRADAPPDYGPILPTHLDRAGRDWQRRIFDAGFAGIHWPVEHGGRGLTVEHTAAWTSLCAEQSVPPFLNMVGCVLTAGALFTFGTDTQRAEHLRPIITGEQVWCQLFSEPGAGSDLASLTTRAERDGDRYVVNGQKVWCSNGRIADRGILMARTDPDAAPHRGISFLLVDMHAAGVETRPLRQMNGGAEFDEVFLTDLAVPVGSRVGDEGAGWAVAMGALTSERGYIGGSGTGTQRRLDALRALGGELDPVGRQELAALWSRASALGAMGARQGPIASVLSSLAKLGSTELLFDTAELAADRAGAYAMLEGREVDGLLGAPGARIAGGTSQIQRNIIGERILGLPKEPRPPDA
ncbi:MAG: acyl-CoA dehydrogenase family protein [Acidimicrobiia bacterium]